MHDARAALQALDRALAQQPHQDGPALSEATRHLCKVRDALARRPDADAATLQRLGHVNAVISIVLAGHYPTGPIPWSELARARTWLAEVAEA